MTDDQTADVDRSQDEFPEDLGDEDIEQDLPGHGEAGEGEAGEE